MVELEADVAADATAACEEGRLQAEVELDTARAGPAERVEQLLWSGVADESLCERNEGVDIVTVDIVPFLLLELVLVVLEVWIVDVGLERTWRRAILVDNL